MQQTREESESSDRTFREPATKAAKMKNLALSILSVVTSATLFLVSYIAAGWGVTIGDRYGAIFFAAGTSVYFVSLGIAVRTQIRALIAAIAVLGVILGVIVILITIANTYHLKWLPAFVIVWIGANAVFFRRAFTR